MTISFEDLCDGVDVCGGSQIQAQVVRDSRVHDGPSSSLHRVVEAGVNDILLRRSRHSSVKLGGGGNGNSASDAAKTSFQGVLL